MNNNQTVKRASKLNLGDKIYYAKEHSLKDEARNLPKEIQPSYWAIDSVIIESLKLDRNSSGEVVGVVVNDEISVPEFSESENIRGYFSDQSKLKKLVDEENQEQINLIDEYVKEMTACNDFIQATIDDSYETEISENNENDV